MTATTITVPPLTELREATWTVTAGPGRPAEPSPYLPYVEASVQAGTTVDGLMTGKAFSFDVELNGKNQDEKTADLQRHIRLLRKAGAQFKPEPVGVAVQASDIVKGKATITFMARTRRKHSRESNNGDGNS